MSKSIQSVVTIALFLLITGGEALAQDGVSCKDEATKKIVANLLARHKGEHKPHAVKSKRGSEPEYKAVVDFRTRKRRIIKAGFAESKDHAYLLIHPDKNVDVELKIQADVLAVTACTYTWAGEEMTIADLKVVKSQKKATANKDKPYKKALSKKKKARVTLMYLSPKKTAVYNIKITPEKKK